MTDDYSHLLRPVYQLAEQAGEKIMQLYASDTAVELKTDRTPVTEADLMANQIIVVGLKKLTPDLPILSEEFAEIAYDERVKWPVYWLIDPLDGTKEYIERTGQFTVNIALVADQQPVLGVVYVPTQKIGYEACRGFGAFKRSANGTYDFIQARNRPTEQITVAISRRHGKRSAELLQGLGKHEVIYSGSALKICLVAEGTADLYPRYGITSEWDTAAGHCVLTEAGGRLMDFQGEELRYNTKPSTLNPEFIAVGDATYDWLKDLK